MFGTNRTKWMWIAAIALAMVYAGNSWLQLQERHSELQRSRDDLEEIRIKLASLQSLSAVPRIASIAVESPAETTTRISDALRTAGLSVSTLQRQEPTPPRRIDQSDFEIRQTTIGLAPATLPQIAMFADALRNRETGSMVSRIRLTPPTGSTGDNGSAASETWKSEMTLTQVIFSPKSQR